MTLAALLLAAAASTPATPPRAVVPEDHNALQEIMGLEVSPDGATLALVISRVDETKDAYRRELWVADAEGGNRRRVCRPEADCGNPRFAPDGKRWAYLSNAKGKSQIFVGPAGTRGRAVTSVEEAIGDYDWSPDARALVFEKADAYVARVAPGAPQPSAKRQPADDGERVEPWVITRTQIQQDGEGFLGTERTHLWIVDAAGGTPRQLTRGPYDDATPRWSPKGDAIAFVSNRNADPDASDDTDVWVIRPDGKGLRKLAANPGPDEAPSWSPDGDRIAYVASRRPNDYYQTNQTAVVPVEGGAACDLTGALDAWVSTDDVVWGSSQRARILWSADGKHVYVPLDRRGANRLVRLPSDGGEAQEILGGAAVHGRIRLARATGRVYYTASTPTTLSELWSLSSDGSAPRKLWGPNDAFFAGLELVTPSKLVAKSPAGGDVEAWLYPPVDRDPSKRYPMILYIHGGPQEYDGEYFDTGLENQLFPGKGWAVLRVNYRGSTSYGEAFSRALWGDWHRREHEDLMAAVDAALAANPWIDPERLGLGGWSYGGIMTVWTVGHTSRFKVGVPERFESDYLSSYGTDQWQAQYLAELGVPWEKADRYRELSPGTYLPKIETPLYLIANEEDGNCPPTQAMQLYQRLKLKGVPTELVIYPGENHSMTVPSHFVDRLYRLVDWYGRHLK